MAYRERENSMSFLYTNIICRHGLNGFAIGIIAIHVFKCFLSLVFLTVRFVACNNNNQVVFKTSMFFTTLKHFIQ